VVICYSLFVLIIRGLLELNPCHIVCLREALPIGVWNLKKCPGTRAATRAAPTKSGFFVCNLPGFYVSVAGATLVVARLWSPACGRPLSVYFKNPFESVSHPFHPCSISPSSRKHQAQIPINTSIFVPLRPKPCHQKLPYYTHRMADRFAAIPHHHPEIFAAPASCRKRRTLGHFRF
jgi:hypothetical protein